MENLILCLVTFSVLAMSHINIQVVLFCSLCAAAGKTVLCIFIRPSHSHWQNGGAQRRALCCKKRYNWTALLHSLFFSQVTHSPSPVCLCWTAAASLVAVSTSHEWPQSCFAVPGVERLLDCTPPPPFPSPSPQFSCAELLPFHLLQSGQVMSGFRVVLLCLLLRGYWTAPTPHPHPQPFSTSFLVLNCCHFTCWNQDRSWVAPKLFCCDRCWEVTGLPPSSPLSPSAPVFLGWTAAASPVEIRTGHDRTLLLWLLLRGYWTAPISPPICVSSLLREIFSLFSLWLFQGIPFRVDPLVITLEWGTGCEWPQSSFCGGQSWEVIGLFAGFFQSTSAPTLLLFSFERQFPCLIWILIIPH